MDKKQKLAELTASAQKSIDAAKAATTDADRRRHLAEAKAAADGAKAIRHDLAIAAEAQALAAEIGDPLDPSAAGSGAKGGSKGVPLATKAGREGVAKAVADRLTGEQADGSKAALLPSGAVVVGVPDAGEVVREDRPARLLEVLPYVRATSPVWKFARQTLRDNKAAIAPAGTLKPESNYSIEVLENRLEVVAHWVGDLDRYVLSDAPSLQRFVAGELSEGVLDAAEAEIVAGDGTEGHFEGLLNVDGSITQAFDVDPLRTIRLAQAMGEVTGTAHDLVVLHPLDWARLELQRAPGSGAFDLAQSPVDSATKRVWGMTVVTTPSVPEGTAVVLDRDAVAVRSDGEMRVVWSDTHGDNLTHNKVTVLAEERFAFEVYRPSAVTIADLTA
ncbi:phage major capsid protein [Rhodococcus pyridinivorans]|uniref:phage major capsid protein n=1 Tax=Rhodococcus pyridinivorans TaxID=103816 RepID=UPI001E5A0199|nr:phage major capsid protein [Rhodococcus pyridinivorans]MCD2142276.1 phage major capsid protein [Rhodococcus pyridinivorans]